MLKMGSGLTIILLFCCILSGCDFNTNPVEPTPTPTPITLTINITREEFDEAKAKWQALGVQEYRLRVDYSAYRTIMGEWTLHVRSSNGKDEIVDFVRESHYAPPVGGLLGPGPIPTQP